MIQILYLAQGMGIGGTEKQLLQLVRGLDRRRFSPILAVFSGTGPLRQAFADCDVPIVDLDLQFPLLRLRNVRPLWRLWRLLHQGRFDVLHAWLYHANVLAAIGGRWAGISHVILSERDVGFFHGEIHRLVGRLTYRRAPCLIANSPPVREALTQNLAVPPDRIVVISNGIPFPVQLPTATERAQARRHFGLPTTGSVVATVGRLTPVKGQRYLLAAAPAVWAAFPNCTFAIAGVGECERELREQAEILGIAACVRFVGEVADVDMFLAAADVFVLPSVSEGLSNALMEAMAAGLPIVATAVGGNCELIEMDRSGLIVPPADPEAIAHAVTKLLQDSVHARALGLAARRKVEPYAVAHMVQRTTEIYEHQVG